VCGCGTQVSARQCLSVLSFLWLACELCVRGAAGGGEVKLAGHPEEPTSRYIERARGQGNTAGR
jgi:hypothetical protein